MDQPKQAAVQLRWHRTTRSLGEATHVQFINDALLPAVAGSGGVAEIKAVALSYHSLEAVAGVGCRPNGAATLVALPAGDRSGARVEQHLGRIKAMAARLQRPKCPVAVAAAQAQTLHLHMPVISRAVPLVQFHHPRWLARLTVGEQQQLDPGGQRGHHRKVDTSAGEACPQRPGVADVNPLVVIRGWS